MVATVSEIAGFWRRAVAFVIDVIILGLIGHGLGLIAEDSLVNLGRWGVVVGLLISAGYFGVLNSALANGQTAGKKLLGIRVVDASNNPVSPITSLFRFLIIGIPGMFSIEILAVSAIFLPLMLVVFVLIGVISFGTFYLFVYNRVNRQTIHDLVVGTYVVRCEKEAKPVGKVWRGHFGFILFVALLALALALAPGFLRALSFSQLLDMRESLLSEPEFSDAGVNFSRHIQFKSSENLTTTMISTRIILKSDRTKEDDLAVKVREIVKKELPKDFKADVIVVVLSYGFNIGIASRYRNVRYKFEMEN